MVLQVFMVDAERAIGLQVRVRHADGDRNPVFEHSLFNSE